MEPSRPVAQIDMNHVDLETFLIETGRMGRTTALASLVGLAPGERHSLAAQQDAVLLITMHDQSPDKG